MVILAGTVTVTERDHLLHQRMLERVACVGWDATLKHEPRTDQLPQRVPQRRLRQSGNRVDQLVGVGTADHRSDLCHRPGHRQTVETRVQPDATALAVPAPAFAWALARSTAFRATSRRNVGHSASPLGGSGGP